jgi:hypothetical protein
VIARVKEISKHMNKSSQIHVFADLPDATGLPGKPAIEGETRAQGQFRALAGAVFVFFVLPSFCIGLYSESSVVRIPFW